MSDQAPESLLTYGFRLLEADLKFLMEAFATTLTRLGEGDLAKRLPWVGSGTINASATDRQLGQAYSIAFQLLNIVEERTASRVRRLRETRHGSASEKGLWADNLGRMIASGLKQDEVLKVLRSVLVEPVLTAHPTEAKRETVRELHREIYSLMNRHENPAYTPREQARLQSQLQTQLENLWRTGEIHVTRPSIEAELQNALYYLREVFPEALARAHTHLREAWQAQGFDAAADRRSAAPAPLRLLDRRRPRRAPLRDRRCHQACFAKRCARMPCACSAARSNPSPSNCR
jgi:phosphoenolpyruvate carboxylase